MYSKKLICDILIYINNNIKAKISIEDLENNFFYNRYYIMKLFKKEIGLTISKYINSIKIYKSINEIRNTNNTLTKIALNNGFYSLEYFSEIFKQITKLNPRKFKNYFYNKDITQKEIEVINNSIINLYEITKIKDIYISKQKPVKLPVKKLTIFK